MMVANNGFHGNERVERQLEEFVTKNNCNLQLAFNYNLDGTRL